MMQVDTTNMIGLSPKVAQPGAIAPRVVPPKLSRRAVSDSIHVSDEAQSLSRERTEQIRVEKVERIRQQIAEGTYVTKERVTAAAAALARALSD